MIQILGMSPGSVIMSQWWGGPAFSISLWKKREYCYKHWCLCVFLCVRSWQAPSVSCSDKATVDRVMGEDVSCCDRQKKKDPRTCMHARLKPPPSSHIYDIYSLQAFFSFSSHWEILEMDQSQVGLNSSHVKTQEIINDIKFSSVAQEFIYCRTTRLVNCSCTFAPPLGGNAWQDYVFFQF